MKAVILAAGKCSRLYPITLEKPKCLLEIGGETIIERQLDAIRSVGIKDITVVTGYMKDAIINAVGDSVRYKNYPDYEKTNNLHTLLSIRDELDSDFVCLFSDVIFETEVLSRAMESTHDICLIVDTHQVLEGTMRIRLEDGKIAGIGSHISVPNGSGNFIGIAKFSKAGAQKLITKMEAMMADHKDDYYTLAIDALAREGEKIGFVDVADRMWMEIDTKKDLDDAKCAMLLREER